VGVDGFIIAETLVGGTVMAILADATLRQLLFGAARDEDSVWCLVPYDAATAAVRRVSEDLREGMLAASPVAGDRGYSSFVPLIISSNSQPNTCAARRDITIRSRNSSKYSMMEAISGSMSRCSDMMVRWWLTVTAEEIVA